MILKAKPLLIHKAYGSERKALLTPVSEWFWKPNLSSLTQREILKAKPLLTHSAYGSESKRFPNSRSVWFWEQKFSSLMKRKVPKAKAFRADAAQNLYQQKQRYNFTAEYTHYLLWKNTGPEELSCQKSDRAGINSVIWPTSNASCRGHPVGGRWSQAPSDANGMTGASLDSMTRLSRTEDYSSHLS